MNTFEPITVAAAKTLIDSRPVQLVDIRDARTFAEGHIEAAVNIDNDSLGPFLAGADKQAPLVVCCYHGISSRNAAQFFAEQGFTEVYSLDGGFEAWRGSL
jgi:thiosulfate sulfurtransferase